MYGQPPVSVNCCAVIVLIVVRKINSLFLSFLETEYDQANRTNTVCIIDYER